MYDFKTHIDRTATGSIKTDIAPESVKDSGTYADICSEYNSALRSAVVVSGGAGGIGSVISALFVEKGYFVVIVDTNKILGMKLASELGSNNCVYLCIDVTDTSSIMHLVDCLPQQLRIAHVITLAGRALDAEWTSFSKQSLSDIDKSIRLNLIGHINTIHSLLPLMEANPNDNKSITLVSSINAFTGFGLPAYSSAKSGLLGLAKSLSHELGHNGIRINAVSLGTIVTPATASEPKDYDKYLRLSALHKFVSVDEAAKLVYFVAAELSCLTGQNIVLDAGQSIPF